MIDEKNKVDHLFVLVGTNTLPNYVAAKLLLRDPAKSSLILVYSKGTTTQLNQLKAVLEAEGFNKSRLVLVPVEESNPTNIENQIRSALYGLQNSIGLHYTGGTKAMSVHAYKILNTRPGVVCSYLDARTLSMVVSGSVGSNPVGTQITVSLKTLLNLHNRSVTYEARPLWPSTAQAIADLHTDSNLRREWHSWIAQTFFREPLWPDFVQPDPQPRDKQWQEWFTTSGYQSRKWVSKTHLKDIELSILSQFRSVYQALLAETGLAATERFCGNQAGKGLMQYGGFKEADDLGKWFEGTWMESYVLQQVQEIKDEGLHSITDVGRGLNAHGAQQSEIDVAFTRGYQFFAIACTTADDKKLCKSKLLEVVIRAEQLGGGEARCALVCCSSEPQSLQREVTDLCGDNVRVFGRDDLLNIKRCFENWIMDVS